VEVKMRIKTGCMHTGICPAGTHQMDILPEYGA
jgi:hypothetical protein